MDCVHCNIDSFALSVPLSKGKKLSVYADIHPLKEGHILIIPKDHISCMGALGEEFEEFKLLYENVIKFLKEEYGSFAVFEHGVTGQTVFHAHMHFLPFKGKIEDIVKEKEHVKMIDSIDQIKKIYQKNGKYMFLQINNNLFSVDTKIGKPKFFRDLFALYYGSEERGNWKGMDRNEKIMEEAAKEVNSLKEKWLQRNPME